MLILYEFLNRISSQTSNETELERTNFTELKLFHVTKIVWLEKSLNRYLNKPF